MKDLVAKMEVLTTEEFALADNNYMTKADDKYMDSIDLSNACREFYQTRKRAAEEVKEKLANSGRNRSSKKKTSIDVAMETLRNEMASLMDQDLSLMKQLLTLNETIEDLKWQKKNHSQSSFPTSSCDLSESDWSVSETDMYDSENEALRKFPTSSPISVDKMEHNSKLKDSDAHEISTTDFFKRPPMATTSLTEEFELYLAGRYCSSEQNSFDSGIHEALVREPISV